MLELVVAGSVVTALLVAATRQQHDRADLSRPALVDVPTIMEAGDELNPGLDFPDLPCPWCESPTREDDRACPSCGQRFG